MSVDVPLSYAVSDVKVDVYQLNAIEFSWDPNKDTGAYIKVNCISTEFTAKKHGGEKGVPFRVQVETYLDEEDMAPRLLHCASCQIKVFKVCGIAALIQGLRPANERRRYFVTTSLIGWAQT